MTSLVEPSQSLPRKRKREETRKKLLDAGLAVFARHGYERATVDEIVREAGFSKGAFYVHFESKEDLFWAMLEDRIAAAQERMRQAISIEDSVEVNERRVLEAVFAFEKEDPSWAPLFLEFAAHGARRREVRERLSALYQRWRSFTVEMLRAGQEAGKVRTDLDLEFMATVMIALIEGTITQARLARDPAKLDRMVEPLAKLLADWLSG
jgi:AcrR family transcriptional regulator